MKDMVIGPGKSKKVSKSSWECRIKKWAEDAQGVGNGTKEPTSSVMGQESPKQHEYKSNEIGPASMGQIISQQEWQSGTTRMVARLWNEQNSRLKEEKPTIKQSPAPKGSSP